MRDIDIVLRDVGIELTRQLRDSPIRPFPVDDAEVRRVAYDTAVTMAARMVQIALEAS